MIILNRDGSLFDEGDPCHRHDEPQCYAEVPAHVLDDQSSLLDRIVSLAFDVLGMRRLHVRVYDTKETCV